MKKKMSEYEELKQELEKNETNKKRKLSSFKYTEILK